MLHRLLALVAAVALLSGCGGADPGPPLLDVEVKTLGYQRFHKPKESVYRPYIEGMITNNTEKPMKEVTFIAEYKTAPDAKAIYTLRKSFLFEEPLQPGDYKRLNDWVIKWGNMPEGKLIPEWEKQGAKFYYRAEGVVFEPEE